jgi:hypothetical protein
MDPSVTETIRRYNEIIALNMTLKTGGSDHNDTARAVLTPMVNDFLGYVLDEFNEYPCKFDDFDKHDSIETAVLGAIPMIAFKQLFRPSRHNILVFPKDLTNFKRLSARYGQMISDSTLFQM